MSPKDSHKNLQNYSEGLFSYLEDVCDDLNIKSDLKVKVWDVYCKNENNYLLEGNKKDWLLCAIFLESLKLSTNSFSNIDYNVSLIKMLRMANMNILTFFDKLKKWCDMLKCTKDITARLNLLEQGFNVSKCLYYSKYLPLLNTIIKKCYHKRHHYKFELYEFIWLFFIYLKGKLPELSHDLVRAFNLLLCCMDLLFHDYFEYEKQDSEIFNKNFQESNDYITFFCEALNCPEFILEVKTFRIHEFEAICSKLFTPLKESIDQQPIFKAESFVNPLKEITKNENLEYNWKRLNKLYEESLLNFTPINLNVSQMGANLSCNTDPTPAVVSNLNQRKNNLSSFPVSPTSVSRGSSSSPIPKSEDYEEDDDNNNTISSSSSDTYTVSGDKILNLETGGAPATNITTTTRDRAFSSSLMSMTRRGDSEVNDLMKERIKLPKEQPLGYFIDERIFLGERFLTAQINTPTKTLPCALSNHPSTSLSGERFSSAKKKLAPIFDKEAVSGEYCSTSVLLTPILGNDSKIGASRKFLVNKCKSSNYVEDTLEHVAAINRRNDTLKRDASLSYIEDGLSTTEPIGGCSLPQIDFVNERDEENSTLSNLLSPLLVHPSRFHGGVSIGSPAPNRQIRKLQIVTSLYAPIKEWLYAQALPPPSLDDDLNVAPPTPQNQTETITVGTTTTTSTKPLETAVFDITAYLKNTNDVGLLSKMTKRIRSFEEKFVSTYVCPIKDEFLTGDEKHLTNLEIFNLGCATYFCLMERIIRTEKFGKVGFTPDSDCSYSNIIPTTPITSVECITTTPTGNNASSSQGGAGGGGKYLSRVLENGDFNDSLLALALDVSCFVFETKYGRLPSRCGGGPPSSSYPSLRDKNTTMLSSPLLSNNLLELLGLPVYTFYRVIELSLRGAALAPAAGNTTELFTREIIRHLNLAEEYILEKLVWERDSVLWKKVLGESLADADDGDVKLPGTGASTRAFIPGCQEVFSARNIEYIHLKRQHEHLPHNNHHNVTGAAFTTPQNNISVAESKELELLTPITGENHHKNKDKKEDFNNSNKDDVTPVMSGEDKKASLKIRNDLVGLNLSSYHVPIITTSTNTFSSIHDKPPSKSGSLPLFFRKVYHLASVRLRDLCAKLDITTAAIDFTDHSADPVMPPHINFKFATPPVSKDDSPQYSSNNDDLKLVVSGENDLTKKMDSTICKDDGDKFLPVKQHDVYDKSKKVLENLQQYDYMESPLSPGSFPALNNNILLYAVWTCFEYCVKHKLQELFMDRHIDQIIMCCVYVMSKVTYNDRSFAEIMKHYRTQPQSNSQIYRCVLLTTPKVTLDPDSTTSQKEAVNPAVDSILSTDTSHNATAYIHKTPLKKGSHGFDSGVGPNYGDIIKFYNQVFVDHVKPFAVRFSAICDQMYKTLGPNENDRKLYHQRRNMSTMLLTTPIDSLLSPIPILTPSSVGGGLHKKNESSKFSTINTTNSFDSRLQLPVLNAAKVVTNSQLKETPYRKRVAANLFVSPLKKSAATLGAHRFAQTQKNSWSEVWASLNSNRSSGFPASLDASEGFCKDDISIGTGIGFSNDPKNSKNTLVYTFNQSPSKDLDKINQMIRQNHQRFLTCSLRKRHFQAIDNDSDSMVEPPLTLESGNNAQVSLDKESGKLEEDNNNTGTLVFGNNGTESVLKKLKLNFMLNKNLGVALNTSNILQPPAPNPSLSAKKSLQF